MIYFDGILYSWQKGGGIYRYFQELMGAVNKRGLDATLVVEEPSFGVLPTETKNLKIDHLGGWFSRLLAKLPLSIARKILSPINKMLAERYFKNVSSGVFHSTYFTTYKNLKIPQVLTVHDMTYEKFPKLWNTAGSKRFIANKKNCIDHADAIICVSEATKTSLQTLYAVPNEKIHVIYHGVDDSFNPDYDHPTAGHMISEHALSKPFILFVGNRSKYKNFNFFLESYAAWAKREEYDVVIVGGGDITTTEKAHINKLGVAKSFKVLGHVDEEQLKTLYCLSKAFIFPSLDEGFGLPILEAICCGTRVLASDIAVFREIGHDIPVFFDPVDKAGLTKALNDVASLPPLTPTEKSRNREIIKKAFSWEKCFDETIAVYKSLKSS